MNTVSVDVEPARAPLPSAVKECSKCGVRKPLSEFYRNSRSPDGYRTNCAECQRIQCRPLGRALYARNPLRRQRGIAVASFRHFRSDPEFWAEVARLDSLSITRKSPVKGSAA